MVRRRRVLCFALLLLLAGLGTSTALAASSALGTPGHGAHRKADVARRVADTVPGNLVVNGSFEGSLTGWGGFLATLTSANDGIDGAGAARVSLNVRKTSDGFAIVPVKPQVASASAG